jgi:hypothetical protein
MLLSNFCIYKVSILPQGSISGLVGYNVQNTPPILHLYVSRGYQVISHSKGKEENPVFP